MRPPLRHRRPPAPVAWTPPAGLSSAQVAERRSRGLTNAAGERTSRPVADILRANIVTRFNLLLGALLAVILVWGEWKDALFGIVLVTNALIGIGQELRAKRTLDRLAVLSAPRVRVIRDGAPRDIAVEELVADDLVHLRAGDQLVADGVVRDSASLQADESLLTGRVRAGGQAGGRPAAVGQLRGGRGRAATRRPGWAPRRTPGSWRRRRGASPWCARSWSRASTRSCATSPGRSRR